MGRNSQLRICCVIERTRLKTAVTSRLSGIATLSNSCSTCRQKTKACFKSVSYKHRTQTQLTHRVIVTRQKRYTYEYSTSTAISHTNIFPERLDTVVEWLNQSFERILVQIVLLLFQSYSNMFIPCSIQSTQLRKYTTDRSDICVPVFTVFP